MLMNSPNSTSAAEGRYFIAILPPKEIAEELEAHKKYCAEHFNSKASLRSPAHITLTMPFLWKEKKEQKLMDTLNEFCKTKKNFSVSLTGFDAFAPRVIYAKVEQNIQLLNFQKELAYWLRVKANLFHPNRYDLPYHPHLTLAFRDLKKEMFNEAYTHFQKITCFYQWQVSSITLLKQENKIWLGHKNIPLN
ncbi:MAG: RNA 2',3'-cyclic phosphodiesterase [Chryseotalea sp.]|jgi:2'-5' RNA ligase|nr:RNA 2',3'-cyclic phosphodiesterase [Flammeovirgaceae bacterium]